MWRLSLLNIEIFLSKTLSVFLLYRVAIVSFCFADGDLEDCHSPRKRRFSRTSFDLFVSPIRINCNVSDFRAAAVRTDSSVPVQLL